MTTTVLEGVRLAYDVRGAGPPVLLVQGLGYGRGGWGPLPELLAERFQVLTFDNRGFGDSDKPAGPYDTAQLAADAAAVLDAAGVERTHVVGASLGGMTAQELALAAPARIDRLVLCCTTPGGADAFPLPAATMELMALAPTLEPLEALRRFVVNALAPDAADSLVEEILAYRTANPPDPAGWHALAAAAVAHDAAARLREIAAPTLVVHGTADNVVDPRNARLLAHAIPNARLELLEGAGHLCFWERPEAFAALLEDFLA